MIKNNVCFSIYEEKYYKKRKKIKKKRKIIAILVIFFIVIISLFTYYFKIINPVIIGYCKAEVNKMLYESANNSIKSVISQYNYDSLVKINYNSEGDISSIYANQIKINELANFISIRTQFEINKYLNLGVKIPLGTCSGLSILSGKGKKINLTINPISSVKCSFKTSFTSAGINQTNHKIFIIIETNSYLVLPLNSENISTNIEFLISECLIVGKIPQTYFNINSLSDIYNN